MKEDDLLGTVNLLKGSPALQMLIIDMEYGPYEQVHISYTFLFSISYLTYSAQSIC